MVQTPTLDFVEPVEKQSIYEKARMCNAFGSSYQ